MEFVQQAINSPLTMIASDGSEMRDGKGHPRSTGTFSQVLGRYALEHKEPLALGTLPDHCELVGGEFWTGRIARHHRLRLAYAVWSVLSRRLFAVDRPED